MEQAERGEITDGQSQLADDDIAFEYMLNALRLPQGFSEAHFCLRTGQAFSVLADNLALAQKDGLIRSDGHGRSSAHRRSGAVDQPVDLFLDCHFTSGRTSNWFR